MTECTHWRVRDVMGQSDTAQSESSETMDECLHENQLELVMSSYL